MTSHTDSISLNEDSFFQSNTLNKDTTTIHQISTFDQNYTKKIAETYWAVIGQVLLRLLCWIMRLTFSTEAGLPSVQATKVASDVLATAKEARHVIPPPSSRTVFCLNT